jgi:hypothetical protein
VAAGVMASRTQESWSENLGTLEQGEEIAVVQVLAPPDVVCQLGPSGRGCAHVRVGPVLATLS